MSESNTAILALEDGSVYKGRAFGAKKTVVGEAVFNTSMTGYQEVLTDPSYFGQIVTMTAVEVGNYGVNKEDEESDGIKLKGFVVREVSPIPSSWRSEMSLQDYLEKSGIPGIAGVDTPRHYKAHKGRGRNESLPVDRGNFGGRGGGKRARLEGACRGRLCEGSDMQISLQIRAVGGGSETFYSERHKALQLRPSLAGLQMRRHRLRGKNFDFQKAQLSRIRCNGVFPAAAPAEKIIEYAPDAVFLSNGPGDPSAVDYAHKCVAKLIRKYPTFGICFGHQVITHAIGATTYKLKFGHRGGNQPVKNLETGIVSITAQNHGFASDAKSVEKVGAVVTEINLNDNTVEGLRLKDLPVFSVQYHPEAAPGPNDADMLFTNFHKLVRKVYGK